MRSELCVSQLATLPLFSPMHPSLLILRAGTNHGNLIIKCIPRIGTLNVCDQGLNDSWPHSLATRWRFGQYYFVLRGGQYGFSNRKNVNPYPMYPPSSSPAPPSGLACLGKEDYVKERPLVCFVLLLVLVFPCFTWFGQCSLSGNIFHYVTPNKEMFL